MAKQNKDKVSILNTTLTIGDTTPKTLELISFEGDEAISGKFLMKATISLTSKTSEENNQISHGFLGQKLSIFVRSNTAEEDHYKREFNGYVTQVIEMDCALVSVPEKTSKHYQSIYCLVVESWLGLLEHTENSRVFQDKTIEEILKLVFAPYNVEANITYDLKTANNKIFHYCIQYRESDAHFAMRLMEEHGVYYYFLSEDGEAKLIITDNMEHHHITYKDPLHFSLTHKDNPNADHHMFAHSIFEWRWWRNIIAQIYSVKGYDFVNPNKMLSHDHVPKTRGKFSDDGFPLSKLEVYDYPELNTLKKENTDKIDFDEPLSRLMKARSETDTAYFEAQTTSLPLKIGYKFSVDELHPNNELQKQEYLITTLSFYWDHKHGFGNHIRAVHFEPSAKFQFTPKRLTKKPIIHGVQTAIVVGPTSNEIYTDTFGRIKVQFHWDREGKNNETSSCFVRVAQGSAGQGYGMMFIPRVGQEVIISFLEGDPDQPLVTGCVYNGFNTPDGGNAFYQLDEQHKHNWTKSWIKTRSSPEGAETNGNTILFDDEKNNELFATIAEKDMLISVKDSKLTSVAKEDIRQAQDITEIANRSIHRETPENTESYDNSRRIVKENDDHIVKGTMNIKAKNLNISTSTNYQIQSDKMLRVEAPESVEISTSQMGSIYLRVDKNNYIKIDQAGITIHGRNIRIAGEQVWATAETVFTTSIDDIPSRIPAPISAHSMMIPHMIMPVHSAQQIFVSGVNIQGTVLNLNQKPAKPYQKKPLT